MWLLQIVQKLLALQFLHRGIEQPRHRRIGKTNQAVLTQHQNAFGRVIQHRCIKGPGGFQIMTQALQGPAVALVFEQRLDLGREDLRVERLEQVIHRTAGIALDDRVLGLFIGGQENDRREAGPLATAHQARHFITVHARHLHVQQHQVDIVFKQQAEGLESRGGSNDSPALAL
ncbi:hypothetical protein D3C71_1087250 [compost metagenome]